MVPLTFTFQFNPSGAQGTPTVPYTVNRFPGGREFDIAKSATSVPKSTLDDTEFPVPLTKLLPRPDCTDSREAPSSETAEER